MIGRFSVVTHSRASRGSGVAAGAVPVDDDRRLVADHPGVVTAGQGGDVARSGDELRAVVHADRELAADVILEVRCLAARGLGDRLHVARPAPAGLELEAADAAAADVEDPRGAVREFPCLVGTLEALVLRQVTLDHSDAPSGRGVDSTGTRR